MLLTFSTWAAMAGDVFFRSKFLALAPMPLESKCSATAMSPQLSYVKFNMCKTAIKNSGIKFDMVKIR